MYFPRMLYAIRNRPLNVQQPETCRVRLGVTIHIAIPGGLPVRWTATTFVRMVFPLYGSLRYFWGRAAMITGEVTFSRPPSASWGQVIVQHMLRLSVVYRIRGVLRHTPLLVTATHVEGARPDISILGASLRWLGNASGSYRGEAMEPAETTQEAMQQVIRSSDVPSSLLSWNRQVRMWELSLPEAAQERCSGRRFLDRRPL